MPCAEKRDGTLVTIAIESRLHASQFSDWSRKDALRWLYSKVVTEFEMHEAGEWFRFGDYRPFDPHASEKLTMDIPEDYANLSSQDLEKAAKELMPQLAYGAMSYLMEKLVINVGDL